MWQQLSFKVRLFCLKGGDKATSARCEKIRLFYLILTENRVLEAKDTK